MRGSGTKKDAEAGHGAAEGAKRKCLAAAKPAVCEWLGASGARYKYFVHPLPAVFYPSQEGNYIFAKKDGKNRWLPLYIGHGNLTTHATCPPQQSCLWRKGATHFHCHKCVSPAEALAEARDLIENHPEALHPKGCNEKVEK